jgi:predicted transcriptional regulator
MVMLEVLFNSESREKVLLYLYVYQEGYAKEISRGLELPLRSVQLQLKRLEEGGVLIARRVDRAIVYQFNPRFPLMKELATMLEKVLLLMPESKRKKYYTPRLRPRRLSKPL